MRYKFIMSRFFALIMMKTQKLYIFTVNATLRVASRLIGKSLLQVTSSFGCRPNPTFYLVLTNLTRTPFNSAPPCAQNSGWVEKLTRKQPGIGAFRALQALGSKVMMSRILGCLLAAMLVICVAAPAQAKTDPLSTHKEAWSGYGDTGYTGKVKSKTTFSKAVSKSGYATKKKTAKKSGTQYAALKSGLDDAGPYKPKSKKKITGYSGGGVRWVASSSCLKGSLVSVVQNIAQKWGSVTVSSTCRSKSHNAKVGGAKRSQHLGGNAVDFRVHGNYSGVFAYLRANVGGVHHYGGGLFHADMGPKRTW
jgi:uncharacterized protein YcbK (DUF882 family)